MLFLAFVFNQDLFQVRRRRVVAIVVHNIVVLVYIRVLKTLQELVIFQIALRIGNTLGMLLVCWITSFVYIIS